MYECMNVCNVRTCHKHLWKKSHLGGELHQQYFYNHSMNGNPRKWEHISNTWFIWFYNLITISFYWTLHILSYFYLLLGVTWYSGRNSSRLLGASLKLLSLVTWLWTLLRRSWSKGAGMCSETLENAAGFIMILPWHTDGCSGFWWFWCSYFVYLWILMAEWPTKRSKRLMFFCGSANMAISSCENHVRSLISPAKNHYLVGGFNPSAKYESQLGWLFPIYGKNKNVLNHQPATVATLGPESTKTWGIYSPDLGRFLHFSSVEAAPTGWGSMGFPHLK